MFQIRLACKKLVIQRVSSFINFGSFQFERVGKPCTAPSSAHGKVHFLVKGHLSVRGYVFEINRTIPFHVPVTRRGLSVSWSSVDSFHVDSQTVVIEVDRVGDYRNDRELKFFILINIGACDDFAGQHSVLEQTEAVGRGGIDREASGCTYLPVCGRRSCAVCGIFKGSTVGYGYACDE